APAQAQLWSWTKDQLTEDTKAWTGERMPDGRPKVSDALIERAKGLSMEEITINWGAAGATAAPASAAGGGGRGGPGGGGRGTFWSRGISSRRRNGTGSDRRIGCGVKG